MIATLKGFTDYIKELEAKVKQLEGNQQQINQ